MRALIVGSGGREHALAWAISKSPMIERVFCTKTNPGIDQVAENAGLADGDFDAISEFCRSNAVDLVVVGPEQPLSLGIVDHLQADGVQVFGPSSAASILESSKSFTKAFCFEHDIPTADAREFKAGEIDQCREYISQRTMPVVIKADGLAAGKGVVIAATRDEAEQAVRDAFSGRFGDAGTTILVEDFLDGREVSLFVISDGKTFKLLGTAQDHKRAFDGDKGPNTGGMGAFSPASDLPDGVIETALAQIIEPTIKGMAERGTPFRGILYAGLMLLGAKPYLIEYNVRFGDPECQVVLPRMKSDFLDLLLHCVEGRLADHDILWHPQPCLSVVMASKGYPGDYRRGTEIDIDPALAKDEDVLLFHAGTSRRDDGQLIATGGRVLNVGAMGHDLEAARTKAYRAVERIHWPDGFFRSDIGFSRAK